MVDAETVRLTLALADVHTRAAAARVLAAHLGAAALLLFVHDAEIGLPLPAAGFPPTLPGGAAWRDFLKQLRGPGLHRSRVAYPTTETLVPALGHTADGLSLVLLASASAEPDARMVDGVAPVLPMLAALLRAEHGATTAQGEVRAAQNHAREVTTLAKALDASRSEVERTVRQLELETRAADEARSRAEEATRAKDEFLAMLGHELRNPLSPIVIALQLMRLKNQSSRELDIIERQVASLMRLVDDLLDVSRITGGKIELRKERIEVAEIAARAIEMASPILEKKQQVLLLDLPPRGLTLDVDPSRIAQVLSNLLTNAAKYSDPDTQIVFSAEHAGNDVRIAIKDHGIGIAPDMLTSVFGLFVQNRQSLDRSQGGLGLGLAIVRSLVELHGGTVIAKSAGVGQGSEFIVTLPCAVLEKPRAGRLTEATALHHVEDRRRVLVV
ncbi:MAG: HAMP domain-containing sensor histidine kinase, partial [Acidobacteriota bacterium]